MNDNVNTNREENERSAKEHAAVKLVAFQNYADLFATVEERIVRSDIDQSYEGYAKLLIMLSLCMRKDGLVEAARTAQAAAMEVLISETESPFAPGRRFTEPYPDAPASDYGENPSDDQPA